MTDSSLLEDSTVQSPERIRKVRPVALTGVVDAGTDLSGIAVVDDFLVLGADAGHQLQILRRDADRRTWSLQQKVAVAEQDQNADIAAITFGRGELYIVCSHSKKRRPMQPDLSVRKNRQRLYDVDADPSRNRLYRLAFDPKTGKTGKLAHIDLSKRLRKDPLLKPFFGIPGKENGVDIKGMTFANRRLLIGFRGPVLRGNHVPVMDIDYENPKGYQLAFVRLEGQGIRDIVTLKHGFLILSGPMNDVPGSYRLWWWDGADQIPGKGRNVEAAVMLGVVSTPGGARAEGMALLKQTDAYADLVLVYETNTAAQLVSMRVVLPGD